LPKFVYAVSVAGTSPLGGGLQQRHRMPDQVNHFFRSEDLSPFVPGAEVAGTVEAVGDGVTGLPVGTRVFGTVGADASGGERNGQACGRR
jgi:NADPH:quinone reductase-like Zn-dependent oxidoreductase